MSTNLVRTSRRPQDPRSLGLVPSEPSNRAFYSLSDTGPRFQRSRALARAIVFAIQLKPRTKSLYLPRGFLWNWSFIPGALPSGMLAPAQEALKIENRHNYRIYYWTRRSTIISPLLRSNQLHCIPCNGIRTLVLQTRPCDPQQAMLVFASVPFHLRRRRLPMRLRFKVPRRSIYYLEGCRRSASTP